MGRTDRSGRPGPGLAPRRPFARLAAACLVAALGLTACASGGGHPAGPVAGRPVVSQQAVASAPVLPAPVGCATCWRPPVRESWQIELSVVPKPPYPDVAMVDADGFDTPAATVAALRASRPHRAVVCYIDAGTWENWRPDARSFPRSLLGKPDGGWPGERWLDIARLRGRLAAIMRARVSMCRAKGFSAVDFDNVDGYTNATGFRLTAGQQLAYDAFLANTAHQAGLAAGLKNDLAQIPALLPYFDFAVDEQCFQYAECTTAQNGGYGLDQFVRAGKPVFDIEYALAPARFCPAANRDGFNALAKKLALGPWREPCRPDGS